MTAASAVDEESGTPEDEEEECVVCFYPTAARTHPCQHVVCRGCQLRWNHFSCPVCRRVTAPSAPSPAAEEAGPSAVLRCVLRLPLDTGHAGITVRAHRHGVRVVKIHPLDEAWAAGVRRGDVITHLNDVRVREATVAVAVIEAMRGADLHLTIRRLPRCLFK